MVEQPLQRIKVTDIELSRPLDTIVGLTGYSALEGLVRLHGRPIGKVHIPIVGDHCSAATLLNAVLEQQSCSTLNRFLQSRLADLPPDRLSFADLLDPVSSLDSWPSVTVAICTRDRPDDLALCLDALNQLDYPHLDLLVIDNAPSDDATKSLIHDRYLHVRYVSEPRPGLSWARNRAIAATQSDIIAFTDDDVIVDPGWVKAIASVFTNHPEVMAVTGYVAAYELETRAQIVFEQAYRFGRGFESKWIHKDSKPITTYGNTPQYGTGANMAFRRSVFDAIGPFDPALGAGTITTGGEDLELFFRLLHEGYTLVYEPAALVRHRHRREYAQLQKQIASNGIGVAAYLIRSAVAYPQHTLAFLKLGWDMLVWWNVRRLLASFIRPSPRRPRDLILAELRGAFSGLNRYPKAQKIAAELGEGNGQW